MSCFECPKTVFTQSTNNMAAPCFVSAEMCLQYCVELASVNIE